MTKYCYSPESIYLDTVSDQQHLFLNTWESVLLATQQCVDLTYIEHAKKWNCLYIAQTLRLQHIKSVTPNICE